MKIFTYMQVKTSIKLGFHGAEVAYSPIHENNERHRGTRRPSRLGYRLLHKQILPNAAVEGPEEGSQTTSINDWDR